MSLKMNPERSFGEFFKAKCGAATALFAGTLLAGTALFAGTPEAQSTFSTQGDTMEITQTWDKTFPQNANVAHRKVTFRNRFGITLVGDFYAPKGVPAGTRLAAIAVSGPFGAVKEQSSGLYAQELAARGFLTLAFDPSFTGESGGEPRYVMSPDINTEDFRSAVDFLSIQENADPAKIGILGICGWGGFALNTAALDTRIKATVASTMYDMTRVTTNGYFDAEDSAEARHAKREADSAMRTQIALSGGNAPRIGGVVDPLPSDAPQFVKDYHAYYKTPRGFHPRSLNSTDGWAATGRAPLLNSRILQFAGEIRSAVLIVHGENAHSRYFGEDAFKKLTGTNKELLIVPGASHTDLYDQTEIIPFPRIEAFFKKYLND